MISGVWVGERDRLQMTVKELLGARGHGNVLKPDSGGDGCMSQ